MATALAAAPAQAQSPGHDAAVATPPEAPPDARPVVPIVVPPVVERRLPNGLSLAVVSRRGPPLVTLMLVVRAGPEADPPGRAGTAELAAALLSKGAWRQGRPVPALQMVRQAEALGGALDSGSTWQATTLSMTVVTPQAEAALALLADAARHPMLAEDELGRARNQAADALRLSLGNPTEVAAMALRRSYWGDTPHGAIKTPATLRRVTRADVQAFHARWFRPDNALLVATGDLDADQAEALARRWLGTWAVPPLPLPMLPSQAPRPQARPLLRIDLPGSGQSVVAVAAPFVAAEATDLRIGQVANAVLGGDYSSRLNQAIRIRRGLSYGAFSRVDAQDTGGLLAAQAQTAPATAHQVLQLMRDEVVGMAAAPPTAAELAARQASLVGSFARRLQTTGSLAGLVASQWVQRRPMAALTRQADDWLSVQPEQVRAFARTHWTSATVRAVVVGDLQGIGEPAPGDAAPALSVEQWLRELSAEPKGR
ncbi:pitrilysin family protein [Ideonella sp. A 288]|uniref:M16 family metallopeptidase n=1 Tax=Ideonella sp. A 288 TaxID=1962181 RepID=UPI0013030745|nr:pitrilysin family protein [Ideonella sp. A 288]